MGIDAASAMGNSRLRGTGRVPWCSAYKPKCSRGIWIAVSTARQLCVVAETLVIARGNSLRRMAVAQGMQYRAHKAHARANQSRSALP